MSDINVARTNMGRDTSNGILSEPKFVLGITYKLKNGLRRIFSKLITQKVYLWTRNGEPCVFGGELHSASASVADSAAQDVGALLYACPQGHTGRM
jgi:hypothetical protein